MIEDINKRIERLRKEIDPDVGSPSLKTLNQVLSGSVNMQVHGGAEEVCTLFLGLDVVTKVSIHFAALCFGLSFTASSCIA